MAKATTARKRKPADQSSGIDPHAAYQAVTQSAQRAALDALDELNRLRESLQGFMCLQSLLTPIHRRDLEELQFEPRELRALVTCINAETQRHISAVGESIELMRHILR